MTRLQAALAAMLLLTMPATAQTAARMDTSGGVAVPSPAISSVPGYPRPSDGVAATPAPKQASAVPKKRSRVRVTGAILPLPIPLPQPD